MKRVFSISKDHYYWIAVAGLISSLISNAALTFSAFIMLKVLNNCLLPLFINSRQAKWPNMVELLTRSAASGNNILSSYCPS